MDVLIASTNATPERDAGKTRPALVSAGLLLGLLLAALDQTIVTTAMPTIARSLGGLDLYSWVFAAYMLLETASTPVFGSLADIFGRRRVYLIGMALFLGGSVAAGLSSSMVGLILSRALQGLGAGALMPLAFTIIADIFPPERRGKMQGLFAAVLTLASLAGPPLGGLVTEKFGWHWAFFMNLPLGVAAVILIWSGLAEKRSERRPQVDVAGALVFMSAMIAFLLSTVAGGKTLAPDLFLVLALVVVGCILLGLFVRIERRSTEPMLPLGLFGNASFVLVSMVALLFGLGMFGSISYLPLFAQTVLGASPSVSGALLIPMMVGMGLGSMAAGLLMTRLSFRVLTITGLGLMVGSFLFFSTMGSGTGIPLLAMSLAISGLGQGILGPTLTTAAQEFSEPGHRGLATSTNAFFRSVGSTFGVSLLGVLLNAGLRARGEGPMAFSASLSTVFLVASGFAAAALVAALFMGGSRLEAPGDVGSPGTVKGRSGK
jgi:EmrB/QacA subfamily drug resistance transporter